MPICTDPLLHSPYMRHLTVKSGEGGHCIFCRGPITLSVRPCLSGLGRENDLSAVKKGLELKSPRNTCLDYRH